MTSTPPATIARDPFYIGWRLVTKTTADGKLETIEVPLTEEDFLYPQEEDRFMLLDHHGIAVTYLRQAIEAACRSRRAIKVLAEHRIDWQKYDLRPNGPDVAVFDNYPQPLKSFRGTLPVADEGVYPLLVIEVTSPNTRHIDLGLKMDVYHEVGIPNYMIVDMREDEYDVPDPIVLLFQHQANCYNLQEPGELGVWVENVGMWFAVEDRQVIAYDSNRNRIPYRAELDEMYSESQKQLEAEKQRAETEKQRADELARELAELKSRLSGQ